MRAEKVDIPVVENVEYPVESSSVDPVCSVVIQPEEGQVKPIGGAVQAMGLGVGRGDVEPMGFSVTEPMGCNLLQPVGLLEEKIEKCRSIETIGVV